ncbi:MAG: hypothetical protein H0X66_12230 [Verrucomicrobia bacterium]|nr:hypothetical protein [Verrucomicrobiota bacterium]
MPNFVAKQSGVNGVYKSINRIEKKNLRSLPTFRENQVRVGNAKSYGGILQIDADITPAFHLLSGTHGAVVRVADGIFFPQRFFIRPDEVEALSGAITNEGGIIAKWVWLFHSCVERRKNAQKFNRGRGLSRVQGCAEKTHRKTYFSQFN